MNIEEQFKKLLNTSPDTIDSDVFLKNLHSERLRRTEKKLKLYHGALSFCFVIVLGFITMNQLTNDPDVYASVDLYSYQEMDEETEEYMNDLAFYLINTSDDIWQTIDFFEKINFENVIAMNNGDMYE